MVFFAPLIGVAAIYSHFARAAPMPDSAIGPEVAVSAPYGTIISDTTALATCAPLKLILHQLLTRSVHSQTAALDNSNYGGYNNNYGNNYGGSNNNYDGSSSSYGYDADNGATDTYTTYSSYSTYYDNYGGNSYSYTNTYTTSSSYSTSTYYDGSDDYGGNSYGYTSVTNTYTAAPSYSTPSYGSGSSSWDNSPYDNCVQRKYAVRFCDFLLIFCSRMCGFLRCTTGFVYSLKYGEFGQLRWRWRYPYRHRRAHSRCLTLCSFRRECLCWRHHYVHVGCQRTHRHQVFDPAPLQQD
jgi:hypothetical protein